MRKNIIGIVFFLLICFFAIWFIVKAVSAIVSYTQLSLQVPVRIEQWSVEEIKSDQFAVVAHFIYEFQSKSFEDSGRVGGTYPNPWAAANAQKQYASQPRTAWLNPKHPDRAFLERKFPYKKAISAGILIALLVYFLSLAAYVRYRNAR